MFKPMSRLLLSALSFSVVFGGVSVLSSPAHAGDFTIDWGAFDWPAGFGGPLDRTLYDQYGFAVDVTVEVNGALATYVNGSGQTVQTPDDDTIFGGNIESLILVSDAPQNAGAIGDSRVVNTVSASSGGVAVQVDNLRIDVLDIDATDNNATSDRCDFLTAFGDNGNPALTALSPTPSVVVGPGPGSGLTGTIAANQAQCIYNEGPAGSPTSPNDYTGTVRATFPDGTSSVTFWYDESIQNVRNYPVFQNYNPGARGIGMFAEVYFTVDQSITLARNVSPATAIEGDTLTYTYTVTNTGTLPFNTEQDVVIEDTQLGTVSCPAITAPVAPGGTVTCTTTYTVTAADVLTGNVDSTATAGIGTIGTGFVSRLQSNSSSTNVATSAVVSPSPLTCTPETIFDHPRTQLAGSGSASALQVGDTFLFEDVATDAAGNFIDIVTRIETISNSSGAILQTTGIEATMTPTLDSHIIYRINLVKDGSATTANPLGDPIDQSGINGIIVQQNDVDSLYNGHDSSDVVGFLDGMPTITHFNTVEITGFAAGGTAIAMDPAKVGDPTNWIEEPNETPWDNFVTYEFPTFATARFIHGFTGSSAESGYRGSNILLCPINETSAVVRAEDDDYTSTPVNNLLGGSAGEVYTNDTINGLTATVATADLSVLVEATPQNIGDPVPFIETSGLDEGRVVVPAGVPAGVYTIEYEMCDALNPGDCDRAKVTVAVFDGDGVDFGDAPLSYLIASHGVNATQTVYLGTIAPDAELIAQSDSTATADDLLGTDDEDAVTFPVLTQGMISTLDVAVTGDGYLQAWIDFNGDGLFEGTLGERIATDLRDDGTGFDDVAGDGVIQIDVTVPTDATTATTFARFRYSSELTLLPSSFAVDGEVEDYSLAIAAADLVDRGDAPASYGDPRHIVVPEIYLGAGLPDTETTTQHTVGADGDDLSGIDDEDAVAVFPELVGGSTVQLTVVTHETLSLQLDLGLPVTEGITNLQLWIDFDQNGLFDTAEQIAVDYRDGGTGDTDGVFNNQITLDIAVPTDAVSGETYARLRWSTTSGVTSDPFNGLNADGEVEDYLVTVTNPEGPLVCDTGFFMVFALNGDPVLEKLQITGSPGSYTSVRTTYPPDFTGNYVTTGWGWNELDHYIYGVLRDTFQLYRVTYSGALRPVVDMAGLGLGTVGSTLEILPNGVMVYNVLNQSGKYQLVDLSDPFNPVNLGILDAGASAPNGLDMTYNPRDGLLYMVANGNSIYAMDPKGGTAGATTTTLVAANIPLPAGFGSAQLDSVWMDENGFFYAYDNNSKQVFYVEVGTEGARPASYQFEAIAGTGSAPIGNDGASCRKGSFYASTVFAEGSISGTIFEDVNADSVLDAGDSGLGAVTVTLYNDNGTPADTADDTLVATTESVADGTYSFAAVDATQTYRIEVDGADADVPANLNLTSANPITGVVVTSGADTGDQNFAFTDPATPVYDPNGPLVCSDTFYMVATETAQNLPALSELRVTESGGTYTLSQTLLPPDYTGNYLVTGWGYNELDGYIYGVRQSPRTLMRIVASGAVQEVADISGLTIESPDTSSDILPNGVIVYMSGTNFGHYQLLDISDPLNPVALGILDTGQSGLYGRDIAYNPRDGLLYFIDSNRNIYAIDPLGGTPGATTITLVGNVPLPVGIFSMDPDSVWFDGSGYLYLFDNQSRQVFAVEVGVEGNRPLTFSFIEVEGTVADLTYQGNDGASCRAPGPFASTLFEEGTISGTLYQDANGNSIFDTGETGVGSVTVTLYKDNGTPADSSDDTLVATTESAADGTYSFATVDATQTYRIEVDGADADVPAGYVISTTNPLTGVVVTTGADTSGQDFGFAEGAQTADLSIAMEILDTGAVVVATASEGDALDLKLTVTNDGAGGATGVLVRDLIPDGYSYVSDDAVSLGDTYDAATGIWDIGAMANGESVTLTIRVTMNATGEHTNTAEIVAADQDDPDSDPGVGHLTDDLSDGIADDDEASATVALSGTGSVLSGTVFRDNGAGGGTAFDGLVNGTESGGAVAQVAIYDSTGTLIDSPEVAADGTWSLTLPTGYTGAITVTVTADADHLVISETPAVLPSLVNTDPRDGSLTFTPAAGTDYAGIDIGVLTQAVLREDQARSISAGQIATLRHEYTADAPGLVDFSLATISETPAGGYSAALFEDMNCDGSADVAITGPIATDAETTICMVLRVSASSSLGPNASYVVKLDATTNYGATGVSEIDSNVDRLTTEARTGALDLSKTVRNVTRGGAEGVRNGGAPGDVLEYRITVSNPTALPASEVKLYDRTPPYTVLAAPIPTPVTLGDMSCTLAVPATNPVGYSGDLRWDCAGLFRPGAEGTVTFQVKIAP